MVQMRLYYFDMRVAIAATKSSSRINSMRMSHSMAMASAALFIVVSLTILPLFLKEIAEFVMVDFSVSIL